MKGLSNGRSERKALLKQGLLSLAFSQELVLFFRSQSKNESKAGCADELWSVDAE